MKTIDLLASANPTKDLWFNKNDFFRARYGEWEVTYDTALPQTLLDDIKAKTGIFCRMFVYGYEGRNEGLIPLDNVAKTVLQIYEHLKGYKAGLAGYETHEI